MTEDQSEIALNPVRNTSTEDVQQRGDLIIKISLILVAIAFFILILSLSELVPDIYQNPIYKLFFGANHAS